MAFTEADITSLVLWQLVVYVVFTLSYVPVWLSRWYLAWDRGDGWRFVIPPDASPAMRAKLLYPPVWLSGPVWWVLYALAGFSAWHAVRSTPPGSTLDAIFIVFLVWMFIQGTWTIPFFYWGLPFWSLVHLGLATAVATAYAVVVATGSPNLTALWLVLAIVIADWVTVLWNLVLFLAYTGRYYGNPIAAFLSRDFNPIARVYRYEEFHRDRQRVVMDAAGRRKRRGEGRQ